MGRRAPPTWLRCSKARSCGGRRCGSVAETQPAAAPRVELAQLVRRAMVLRVVLAVLLHFFVDEYTFAPDQETYHFGGSALAGYWSGERILPPSILATSPKGYFYLLASLYWVLGSWALIPKVLNGVVGA